LSHRGVRDPDLHRAFADVRIGLQGIRSNSGRAPAYLYSRIRRPLCFLEADASLLTGGR